MSTLKLLPISKSNPYVRYLDIKFTPEEAYLLSRYSYHYTTESYVVNVGSGNRRYRAGAFIMEDTAGSRIIIGDAMDTSSLASDFNASVYFPQTLDGINIKPLLNLAKIHRPNKLHVRGPRKYNAARVGEVFLIGNYLQRVGKDGI